MGISSTQALSASLAVGEVAFYGDSITAGSYIETGDPNIIQMNNSGYPIWTQMYASHRFEIMQRSAGYPRYQDHGYSGAQIADLANGATYTISSGLGAGTWQPMANLLATNPKVVVEMSGTNDTGNYFGVVAATVAEARVANWDYMLANGVKRLVAHAILPRDAAGIGTLQTGLNDDVNALLEAAAATRAVTWVPYPTVMKSAGKADINYFRDGIHPNHLGAQVVGQGLALALAPYIQTVGFTVPASGSALWKSANPYMVGGTPVATGWKAGFVWDGTNYNSYCSKVTDGSGTWQRIVMTGNASNANGAAALFPLVLSADTATLTAGTIVRPVMRLRQTGFKALRVSMVQGNSRSHGWQQHESFGTTGQFGTAMEDFDIVFLGPKIEVGTGNKALNLWLTPYGNGTVDVTQAGIITVS